MTCRTYILPTDVSFSALEFCEGSCNARGGNGIWQDIGPHLHEEQWARGGRPVPVTRGDIETGCQVRGPGAGHLDNIGFWIPTPVIRGDVVVAHHPLAAVGQVTWPIPWRYYYNTRNAALAVTFDYGTQSIHTNQQEGSLLSKESEWGRVQFRALPDGSKRNE